ncbi:hypothetical protein KAR91_19740 [Candidatus Pacearchaeota archaeon]|nr:hypothetical protein [Candidatus Pacearchaeota archaeon]
MGGIQKIQKLYALRNISILHDFVLPLFLVVLLSSCAMTYPKVEIDTENVALTSVQAEIPESHLLDIRIQIFDPGELPSTEDADASRGLSEEIRKAESQYMAVQLKKALQQTGYWGAVRVVPVQSSGDEVLVSGCILKSNGEELMLEIEAFDAVGTQWFKKDFEGAVDEKMYKESSKKQLEVFQNVYHQIANELTVYRQTMTPDQIYEIRQVSEMLFAEELVPSAFTGYLQKDEKKGRIRIDRLPSEDDDMLARVRQVRERDYMLVDTLDAHYESLHRDMREVYTDWRKSRLVEMNMIREVEIKQNEERAGGFTLILAGAVLGAAGGKYGG